MTPRLFWTQCRLHDWFYMMSDDPDVYRNGSESEADLLRIANRGAEFMEIYEAWREHELACGPRPDEPKLEMGD